MRVLKNKKNLLSGFLLLDAIFSVVITILCVFTLKCTLNLLKNANKIDHHTDEVVFSYVQFNNWLNNSEYVYTRPKINSNPLVTFDRKPKKDTADEYVEKLYDLELYQNMIRLTTEQGGHMPLLLHVRKADFATSDTQIKVDLVESDRRRTQWFFKTDKRPAKEIKDENNKKETSKS